MTQRRSSWSITEARAHLSEVIKRARSEGPQEILSRGCRTAILISAEEWDRKTHKKGGLVDFLAASPLCKSGLQVKRIRDQPRKLEA
jgi:prevent-host-death family protein